MLISSLTHVLNWVFHITVSHQVKMLAVKVLHSTEKFTFECFIGYVPYSTTCVMFMLHIYDLAVKPFQLCLWWKTCYFCTRSQDIPDWVCGDQNMCFKPCHDLFLTLTKWFSTKTFVREFSFFLLISLGTGWSFHGAFHWMSYFSFQVWTRSVHTIQDPTCCLCDSPRRAVRPKPNLIPISVICNPPTSS